MFLNISIYLYMYTYILCVRVCVYLKNQHTNTAVLHWLFHFSVKDTRFQSLRSRTKVTAEDKELAWCTFPCEGPGWLDSGNLRRTAYCMDRSHSSCHRSWHSRDHRYHTQLRAYTGWLRKGDTSETWRKGHVDSPSAQCHSAGSCHPQHWPFHSTDSLVHFNKGITNIQHSWNTLGITCPWKNNIKDPPAGLMIFKVK